jgi:hypothetical protein
VRNNDERGIHGVSEELRNFQSRELAGQAIEKKNYEAPNYVILP